MKNTLFFFRISHILAIVVLSFSRLVAVDVAVGPVTYSGSQAVGGHYVNALATQGSVVVASGANITFNAAGSIHFTTGFSIASGGIFHAAIVAPNTVPTIASGPTVAANPVYGTTTQLSVLGADDDGESKLTYAWSFTGTPPATPVFASPSSKTTQVTLPQLGSYDLVVTITDQGGLQKIGTLTVSAANAPPVARITSPTDNASFTIPTSISIAASASDSDGLITKLEILQGTVVLSTVSGSSSTYTWSNPPVGTYALTARATDNRATTGTSPIVHVSVVDTPPTIARPATAVLDAGGTFATVDVLGADNLGEPALKYTWSMTSGPPLGSITVADNGGNSSKHTTVTFTRAGDYALKCTIIDGAGQTITSGVSLTVAPRAITLVIVPAHAEVPPSSPQQFTTTSTDQFGQPYSGTLAWSVSGGGSISPTSGLLSSTSQPGGPYDVGVTPAHGVVAHQVFAVGTPPTASALSITTMAGVVVRVPLTATSSVGTLTFVIDTQPANGMLLGQVPALAYQPNAGFTGTDTFRYHVTDGFATSAQATVTITVTAAGTSDRTVTPLVAGTAFDATRWTSDATYRTAYLAGREPGRIWQVATPGASVPVLVAYGARRISIAYYSGAATSLAVIHATAGSPVTFTCLGDGSFYENRQNTVTVLADASGYASATLYVPSSGQTAVLASSPLSAGIVRFVVAVHP